MSREKKITTVALDNDSVNALETMSILLGISKSAIVRMLVNSGYEHFKQDRTLPSVPYRQGELGVTSGG